ncbi:lasso peptide biosynthesis B2 protein [Caulobacter sp. 73W]|uniref:Lasso peptide biosynthesis B2 protein n=1 Tax=Caulobacter sp. 73W TaxID=3161137 RepID=A0AB39KX34_9CAUL
MTFLDHIHVAVIGLDIVLLNERDGEYLCLEGAAEQISAAPGGELTIEDEHLASQLHEMGLAAPGSRLASLFIPPTRDLANCITPTMMIARWAPQLAAAGLAFHALSFPRLISTARNQRCDDLSPDGAAQLSSCFMHVRPWLAFQGLCLKRCFLQLRLLQASHIKVDWVFGVRTWPFSAHCWLQKEDLVLSDTLDRVLLYEPIMRVRA